MKKLLTLSLALCFGLVAHAQMWNGADTLYGNEWINFAQTYYKIKVAEDGIYRIPAATLSNAGLGNIPASQLRLYRYGQQEPVFTTTEGILSGSDFIEFYGEKNRGAVDKYLFDDPATEQINPAYSMFNDTTAYYLVAETTSQPLRYTSAANDLSNLPAKADYCWFTVLKVNNNGFFQKKIGDETTYSWFGGSGFTTLSATTLSITLNIAKIYAAGPAATTTVRYACNLDDHHQQILVNDVVFAEDSFFNFRLVEHAFPVQLSPLTPATVVKVQSTIGDRNGVASVGIRYPRQFDFENASAATFDLEAGAQYLEIQTFNVSGGAPVLYDLTRKIRMETMVSGNQVKVKLPDVTNTERRIFMAAPASGIRVVSTLQAIQFRDYQPEQADYIILTAPSLRRDPANGNADHVAAYAAYRSSPAGGNHKVVIVDINELYEQFAYGVRFHAIAVRNFLHYAKKEWPQLEHAFIIGKSLQMNAFRTSVQQNTLVDSLFFVPTFGVPGTDLLFAMHGNRITEPIVAIGRLAVVKPVQIRDYLDKVLEHEQQLPQADQTIADKAWMKRVLHNSGGNQGETTLIRNHMGSLAGILENDRFGAAVHTFYKTSNDPIQLSGYEQVLNLVNGGVSLWTIFGHSAANAVEFDIGTPQVYDNKGHYPYMVILGCFSGNCSNTQPGIGEDFVLARERGAIAFIAAVNYSYVDALYSYSSQYYGRLGGADYGKSIGTALNHAIGDLKQTNYSNLIAVLHQVVLQGDPAIHLNVSAGPDYVVDNQTFNVDPNPVGLEQNTFKLKFDVANIGENTGGQLALKIEQRLPDNTTVLARLTDTIPAPPNRSALEYTLPVAGSRIGLNRFFITADPANQIAEAPPAAEQNNALTDATGERGADVYFYSDDVQPVYPPPYGIVRKPSVTLRASTLNTSAAVTRYFMEFDTLETFNSPFKLKHEIQQRGGLLEWTVPASLTDSTVYYWRIARDSLVNGAVLWRNRSFIYIKDSPAGWNQSHYGQYKEDVFTNLQAVDSTRRVAFLDNAAFLSMQVSYRGTIAQPGFQNSFYEGFFGNPNWNEEGVSGGVVVVVVDQNTGRMVQNPPGGPHNFDPPKERFYYYFNTYYPETRAALMEFLQNEIPDGRYVGLMAFNDPTSGGYAPLLWADDSIALGKNLFQVLEQQGAKKVRQLTNFAGAPRPYGLLYRKGDPTYPVQDTIVTSVTETFSMRASFLAKWSVGRLETPVIGPVKSWKSVHWARAATDNNSDQAQLSIIGVRPARPDTVLLTMPVHADLALDFIKATDFPQLKLRYDVRDTLLATATALRYARILYEGLPEGALHPTAQFSFYRDTLQQGEKLSATIAFANIADAPMDSVLVKFRVENAASVGTDVLRTMRPLPVGDSLQLQFTAETRTLNGPQRLLIDVNPDNNQPEQFHFNNVLIQDFFVAPDTRNPLLDVTFDGAHLLDGDLVSPQPIINVTLKDDNHFLAITDTNTFVLTLYLPDGTRQTIPFNDPNLLFFPGSGADLPKKNQARLEWRPTFLQDGTYRLQVNGRDATGNKSAALDFSITFKVITKSSISNVLNYPNPFSTSTCFIYTLTGTETPVNFKLQIMTVSGKVVREITTNEFGPLRAGTHQSDYCWNGKDEYGDQLANGVYLYRIVAKKADGSNFEFMENQSVDGFFKQGLGKMVLMR